MHSQLLSQQIAIEGVKDKLNREKKDEMERREQEFEQDMGELNFQTGCGTVTSFTVVIESLKLLSFVYL